MYSVFDIANWFLQKGGSMDHVKLQNLCCYAQAWYLALNTEKLFKEDFDAPISKKEFEKKSNVISNVNGDVNFLNEIWETYGRYSGKFLSEQAHKNPPWTNTKKGLSNLRIDNIYSKENQKYLRDTMNELKEGKFEEHELIEVD